MIRFEEIKEVEMPEFKGGTGVIKGRMFVDKDGKIMKLTLPKGTSIGQHTHTENREIVYVISGTATCLMDGKEEAVGAGEFHYCPKGSTHCIRNEHKEDLVLFCVVPEG